MLDGIDNLIEMSLRLNESTPSFQTIQEILHEDQVLHEDRDHGANSGHSTDRSTT